MRRALLVSALCCAVGGGGLVTAQEEDRVTVGMRNGDVIEGVFRGATEGEISIQVAGQPLTFPVFKIKYVSFVGALGDCDAAGGDNAAPANAKPAAGSLDDAFQALDELQAALRIGVLRAQYAEKLVETLPRVNAYLDQNADEWHDVQALLHGALVWYKAPLGEITKYSNPWENASDSFGRARDRIDYARALASNPEERTHRESPDEKTLELGVPTSGRIGIGDRDPEVTGDDKGWLADLYRLDLAKPGKLVVEGSATPCDLRLILTDDAGKKLTAKDDALKKDLKSSGTYYLWVAARGGPATYTLTATLRP